MPLLEVSGLIKNYGRRRVVNGVSFQVDAGEIVGLLGPNGAGKTTSFRMTTGMVAPNAGKVVFTRQDVTNWPMYKRARLGMGYLSQESSVFRKLTVEQNVLAILEAMPRSRRLQRKLTARERWERTDQVLEDFGLTRVRKNYAERLSGGERRRLEIARCLVCEPLLILLDEPFTGIDPITITDIQGIVRRLRDDGIGLLITDHNVRETLKITDRSYVIADGTVEAHGTPAEIVRNEVVINRYLGREFVQDAFAQLVNEPAAPPAPVFATACSKPLEPVSVRNVLQYAHVHDLVDELRTEARHAAEEELLRIGRPALPALLEALDRRDAEMRRLAFDVVQRIVNGVGHFDPYAPLAERQRQIEILRDGCLRKAG
jgi:lipopolysaccharide export system ATP-binding protein